MALTRFSVRSAMPVSAEELYRWHLRPGALERMIPGWDRVRVVERSGPLGDGARVVLRIPVGPFGIRWVAEHRGFDPPRGFEDVQRKGPFATWIHRHRMHAREGDRSTIEDEIDYALPFGALGDRVGGGTVRRRLGRMFAQRHAVLAADLERHRGAPGPLDVAVSGSSGLVGSALVAFLESGGHRVRRLVRRAASGPDEIAWDPESGIVDPEALSGLDGVVHLAGENIASGRWSPARKEAIRRSRIGGTAGIARALAGLERPPPVLVAASAVGYYGDRGEEPVDESARAGQGFLARTCVAWEAATRPAREAGVRVVSLRIGIVLAAAGGALPRMVTPMRFGLGGRLGSGRQYMSWIALDDLVGAIHHVLCHRSVEGPVNAVAPDPRSNADFVRTLGRVLRRPALVPAPAFGLRLLLGEMADALLLEGARVVPDRLLRTGFVFRRGQLPDALRHELGLRATQGLDLRFERRPD